MKRIILIVSAGICAVLFMVCAGNGDTLDFSVLTPHYASHDVPHHDVPDANALVGTPLIPYTAKPAAQAVKPSDYTTQLVYHGNVKSYVFHAPGCRYYDCKNCVRIFKSRSDAISAGFRPCKICKP